MPPEKAYGTLLPLQVSGCPGRRPEKEQQGDSAGDAGGTGDEGRPGAGPEGPGAFHLGAAAELHEGQHRPSGLLEAAAGGGQCGAGHLWTHGGCMSALDGAPECW